MHATRRQFLVGGVRLSAVLPLCSSMGRSTRGDGDPEGNVLVVLQLTGGNDGLNMVVPRDQDAYFRLRPTLALPANALHALDDRFGWHPKMPGLARLHEEGRVAVVHGVGYPRADRSHFRSMEIWHTAAPDEADPRPIGWMGRLADQIARHRPGSMPALHVGAGDLPLALYARDSFAPSARDEAGFRLRGDATFADARDALLDDARDAKGELAFLREAARSSYAAAARMSELAGRESPVEYPGGELARRLRLVARLVAGGFDTRLFHVELGGFDTHARQGPAHAALLEELSKAVTAFQRDLQHAGVAGRVVTLVFSEFGRRVAENGSKGTDHGAAAPVLLVGDAVRGGMHGTPPDLGHLADGDVPYGVDFRSVYTDLERAWMGLVPSTSLPAIGLVT